MSRYELEGVRIPVDHFGITIEELPIPLRPIFPGLEEAAEIAGELYALQMYHLGPYREKIASSTDPAVKDLFTVPTKDGKFVDFFDHSSFKPLLLDAQSKLLNAARMARDAREYELGNYLWQAGLGLTSRRYDEIVGEYLRLHSRINFYLLPIETDRGKRVWAGYVAIDDREETREVGRDIAALRAAGIRRNNGFWFTPQTDMRVDKVSVMAGSLGSEVQRLKMGREWFLPEQGIISAINLPDEPELMRQHGNRITVLSTPFNYVYQEEIVQKAKPFTKLYISKRGCLRFIAAHELSHDEKYDDSSKRLGFLHQTLRESYANVLGLDLSAEVWDPGINYQYETVVKGATGYAFRDCYGILQAAKQSKEYPDLGTMVKLSPYIPGNLSLLHLNLIEGAYILREGMISDIDPEKAWDVAKKLVLDQRKLLQKGSENDTRDYFESILPKEPLFLIHNQLTVA